MGDLILQRIVTVFVGNVVDIVNTFLLEDAEFVQGGFAIAGMDANGQSGFAVHVRGRTNQFAMERGEFSFLNPQFDESGSDARPFDAMAPFIQPTFRQLIRGFGIGMPGEKFVSHRTIITGVGHDMEITGF